MSAPTKELDKITTAVNKLGMGWNLCFVGEDQASKLGTLTSDLRKGVSETGDGKRIASGFSYWGIGPTIAWLAACKDSLYPVMNQSIRNFSSLWDQARASLDPQNYHYVSLGVGSGEKDGLILRDLHPMNAGLYYFPVDMSPEMLRMGGREAMKNTQVERSKLLPVQIDFSLDENAAELRDLLDRILGDAPILFSLLGNTLSNFEYDVSLLSTISLMIKPKDRLLLEVAFTDSLSDEALAEAAEEYDRSRMFKEFVSSSLFQNTDLRVDIESICFTSVAEKDRAILIKSLYRNTTGKPLRVTLPDRTPVHFPERDTIRLLTMRKYTEKGIGHLLGRCGLSSMRRVRREFPTRRAFRFGTELLLLSPSGEVKKETSYVWALFLAHAGADSGPAKALYDLLSPHCKIFLDSESLMLGDDWDRELSQAQRKALVTVVLVSPKTDQAYYQREEIAAAIHMARTSEGEHRVVPVFLEGANPDDVPYGLRLKHGLHLSPTRTLADAAKELLNLIAQLKQ
jgi:L-histidine N-alpha-methyltransferase